MASEDAPASADARVRDALASGRGLECFRKMVGQQGGDPRIVDDYARLPAAPKTIELKTDRDGYIADLDAEALGTAGMALGGGRRKASDRVETVTAGIVDALTLTVEGLPAVVVDWKSDVTPTPGMLDHYRAQVRAYLDITGATRGLIVLMTSGTVISVSGS